MKTEETTSEVAPSHFKNGAEDREYSKVQRVLIAIACMTIFPLIYLLGRLITFWLKQ